MTSRHFIDFADFIASEVDFIVGGVGVTNRGTATLRMTTLARCADHFAHMAAKDNPRFDRARFAVACHLPASILLFADPDGTCHGIAADGKTQVPVIR